MSHRLLLAIAGRPGNESVLLNVSYSRISLLSASLSVNVNPVGCCYPKLKNGWVEQCVLAHWNVVN